MFKQASSQARATQRGQGMTEYIIIVALIAVAAIVTYQFFGKTVRNQTAAIAADVGGNATQAKAANDRAVLDGKAADTDAQRANKLSNFTTGNSTATGSKE